MSPTKTRASDRAMEEEHADSSSLSTVDQAGACALCHCSLDYSDLAAFDATAREEDYSDDDDDHSKDSSEYIFRKNDPLLPKESLYQPANALVYCDTCHRWFHQMCHFVPIFVLPSNAFTCLLCHDQAGEKEQQPSSSKKGSKKKTKQLLNQPSSVTSNHNHTNKAAAVPPYPLSSMFRSPPNVHMASYEAAWECDPRVILLKRTHWADQLHLLEKRRLPAALQKYRRRQRTWQTLLWQSSARTRQWHVNTTEHRVSQELLQCLVASTRAQCVVRQYLHDGLEFCRHVARQTRAWSALQAWCQSNQRRHGDFIQRILFPFGRNHARRWCPVTPECPVFDQMTGPGCSDTTRRRKKKKKPVTDDDDDSGVSVDQLQCCICLAGDCTDDNDLLLCDGAHCHRAYHQDCLWTDTTDIVGEEDEDWFCPLCQTHAECLYQIQRHVRGVDNADDDDSRASSASSNDDEDVFPDAERDHALALQLQRRRGRWDTPELHQFLLRLLGPDVMGSTAVVPNHHPDEDDDEDEDDEDHGTDGDDSSTATLGDLSSVELHVPVEEVVALKQKPKVSPRSPRRRVLSFDPGQMDLANILTGKRPRRPIDYRQLNDALFGQLTERELQEWDA